MNQPGCRPLLWYLSFSILEQHATSVTIDYAGILLIQCQIKLLSLQSMRLSTSTDGCTFRPRKASKVEKPSSRGVSSLHRWSLMLLPVLWPMPLCALCTHVCVSTTLSLLNFAWLPHCCSFPELVPMTQMDLSASLWLHVI